MDFVSTTETPDNEKEARRLVRSEVMKNYHTKRREALHVSYNVERSSVNRWRGDPFVKFPVELTSTIKEFLDLGPSTLPPFFDDEASNARRSVQRYADEHCILS